jgi:preprotein translocase subunit Sec63
VRCLLLEVRAMDVDKADEPKLQDDPFTVLGLSREATDDEIKAAHRKLALRCVSCVECWYASVARE